VTLAYQIRTDLDLEALESPSRASLRPTTLLSWTTSRSAGRRLPQIAEGVA
jgi:hypothetical protein